MTIDTSESIAVHGGRLVARRLAAHGVTKLFTLSGGHLFSIYDGCREEGIDIVDVRHESAAAFAAEGWAKVTRQLGVAALTAGPGVTNGMSALGSAQQNNSPIVVLGGRAPALRWGQGSLQGGAARAGRGAQDPRVPQRPGARVRGGGPRAVLLPRARDGPEGRGPRARGRRADGLPPGLRPVVRRADRDRRDRSRRAAA